MLERENTKKNYETYILVTLYVVSACASFADFHDTKLVVGQYEPSGLMCGKDKVREVQRAKRRTDHPWSKRLADIYVPNSDRGVFWVIEIRKERSGRKEYLGKDIGKGEEMACASIDARLHTTRLSSQFIILHLAINCSKTTRNHALLEEQSVSTFHFNTT
jgi:hypothetical protein